MNYATTGTVLFAGTTADIVVPASQTASAFALLHFAKPPGCWTPAHRHRREDETVYVLSGSLRAETEDCADDLAPGEALVLPRDRPHRLGNTGAGEARFLVLCTPGGFDSFVHEAGRPFPAGDRAVAEDDAARLMAAAPHYGIELLPLDALRPVHAGRAKVAPEATDVLGVTVEILAEVGPEEDDLCLIRGSLPPGGVVPLHSHADRETLYGLSGTMEVSVGPVGAGSWHTVATGDVVDIPSGVPHALRNRGEVAADSLLVTTRRIAELFREVGCPTNAVLPGPPSPARLNAFVVALRARGFWLANPEGSVVLSSQPG